MHANRFVIGLLCGAMSAVSFSAFGVVRSASASGLTGFRTITAHSCVPVTDDPDTGANQDAGVYTYTGAFFNPSTANTLEAVCSFPNDSVIDMRSALNHPVVTVHGYANTYPTDAFLVKACRTVYGGSSPYFYCGGGTALYNQAGSATITDLSAWQNANASDSLWVRANLGPAVGTAYNTVFTLVWSTTTTM